MTTKTNKQIIRKVWKISRTGVLLVTVPRDEDIKVGDYVNITKVIL
jgi:hypothetical protein